MISDTNNSQRRGSVSASRREFLSKTAKSGAAITAALSGQSLGIFGFSSQKTKMPYLDPSWIEETDGEVVKYAKFLCKEKYDTLSLHELLKAHFKKRHVRNTLPPRDMWENIVPTLKVVDQVAKNVGCTCAKVVSAYRSPDYNYSIGGAKNSCHMRNLAIDVEFGCSSWKAMRAACVLRKKDKFIGGLGVYNNFIHIDTRDENVNWGLYKYNRS